MPVATPAASGRSPIARRGRGTGGGRRRSLDATVVAFAAVPFAGLLGRRRSPAALRFGRAVGEPAPTLELATPIPARADGESQEDQRVVEVLPLRDRGATAAVERLDHAAVRHQDLPSELAIAASDAERHAD